MILASRSNMSRHIIIGKSLQEAMIEDFSLEYAQQKKLRDTEPNSPHGLRASERMKVISQSIEELKMQIKNPERHAMMIHGGYSKEEMDRIEHLPRNLNGV